MDFVSCVCDIILICFSNSNDIENVLGGLSGSTGIGIGGGSIADLFAERERAGAMALYILGPLFGTYYIIGTGDILLIPLYRPGPILGPIAGGFITQHLGVEWVFIVIASASYSFYYQRNALTILIFGIQL